MNFRVFTTHLNMKKCRTTEFIKYPKARRIQNGYKAPPQEAEKSYFKVTSSVINSLLHLCVNYGTFLK